MARAKQRNVPVAKPRNFIREWRVFRELSLRELGKRIGISHVSLRRIETGETDWNETTLSLLAQALGTDVPSLLARDPTQTEGIWTAWNDLNDAERRQLVELARALKAARPRD